MKTDLQRYEFHGGPLDGDVRELPGEPWFRVETLMDDGETAVSWYQLADTMSSHGRDYHLVEEPPEEITQRAPVPLDEPIFTKADVELLRRSADALEAFGSKRAQREIRALAERLARVVDGSQEL